jgi:hypothetical protein
MSSQIKLKNNINSEFTVTHEDNQGAISVSSTDLAKVVSVDTIADLRATTKAQPTVWVSGYYEKGDGALGSNIFEWDATSTEDDNGGTIIKLDSVATGRYKLRYSGSVNVKWFGAVGDGATDDTAALQNAINYSNSIGNTLTINAGRYLVSSTIYVGAGARIEGTNGRLTGIYKKTVLITNTSLNPIIDISNLKWGYIGGINLEGNNVALNGIGGYNVFGATLENIRSENMVANGFRLTNDGTGIGCFSNSFIRCAATSNGDSGFLLDHYASNINDILFDDCISISNQYGIRETGDVAGRNITIQNCDIENNSDYGVFLHSKGFVISGTYFEWNGLTGSLSNKCSIYIDNTLVENQGGIIFGCTILGNKSADSGSTDIGIYVYNSYNTNISNCWITYINTGIQITGTSRYIQLVNNFYGNNSTNILRDSVDRGILTSRGNQISRNVFGSAQDMVLAPYIGIVVYADVGNNTRTATLNITDYNIGEGHKIFTMMNSYHTGSLTITDSSGATFTGQNGGSRVSGSTSIVLGYKQSIELIKISDDTWIVHGITSA